MTPELIARVDAWLVGHDVWVMATDERSGLAFVWFELRAALGRESRREAPTAPFIIAGYHSAMTGVLLALVSEAWGGTCICTLELIQTRDAVGFSVRQSTGEAPHACRYIAPRATKGEALVVALERSP